MGLLLTPNIPDEGAVAKKSITYSFTGGVKPTGALEDATRSEMIPMACTTRLKELNATGSAGGSAVFAFMSCAPADVMNTRRYRAKVIVGGDSSGTDRGCIVWVGGQNGSGGDGLTNLVGLWLRGQGGLAARIITKVGNAAVPSTVVNGSNALVVANDTIELEISESGGIYTYTGYKNGTPLTGATWTDNAAVIGVPGKMWGVGLQGGYSGGYFPSLGSYGMNCADI